MDAWVALHSPALAMSWRSERDLVVERLLLIALPRERAARGAGRNRNFRDCRNRRSALERARDLAQFLDRLRQNLRVEGAMREPLL